MTSQNRNHSKDIETDLLNEHSNGVFKQEAQRKKAAKKNKAARLVPFVTCTPSCPLLACGLHTKATPLTCDHIILELCKYKGNKNQRTNARGGHKMLNCTPGTRASMKHSTPVLKSLHKCVSFSGGSASVRNLAVRQRDCTHSCTTGTHHASTRMHVHTSSQIIYLSDPAFCKVATTDFSLHSPHAYPLPYTSPATAATTPAHLPRIPLPLLYLSLSQQTQSQAVRAGQHKHQQQYQHQCKQQQQGQQQHTQHSTK